MARPVAAKPREPKPAAPPRKPARRDQPPVSPNVARQHFLEILKAKQERVRQGPAYPAANAFTGHRDGAGTNEASAPGEEAPAAEPAETTASFDGAEQPHGRGNQGMRPQK